MPGSITPPYVFMLVWAVLLVFCLLAGVPTRLGADARMLSADYELVQVTPLDLFPHSPHVESVSCWQRRA